jgi:hypothetical protein
MSAPSPAHASPLHAVYYTATFGRTENLVRHLIALSSDTPFQDGLFVRDASLLWRSGDLARAVDVFVVATRTLTWNQPIQNILDLNDVIPQELEALRRADVIIFLAGNYVPFYGRNLHFIKLLRADLVAAGRDPDQMPLLFQIQRAPAGTTTPTTLTAELIPVLSWPHCDHREAFPEDGRGYKEALDRAIELYDERRRMTG